ncbi:hypothetical protein [Aquisediminimonas profunda]|uniref:hypothetical protein n=1 Tax=Aquisediminimonas profunda TaxID=1550733 RepID=UPI001C638A47|nr:hypothetical protein [Aquisediminimonas profunda]
MRIIKPVSGRKAKADAAVRFAEQTARQTGEHKTVTFRLGQDDPTPATVPAKPRKVGTSGIMQDALSDAFKAAGLEPPAIPPEASKAERPRSLSNPKTTHLQSVKKSADKPKKPRSGSNRPAKRQVKLGTAIENKRIALETVQAASQSRSKKNKAKPQIKTRIMAASHVVLERELKLQTQNREARLAQNARIRSYIVDKASSPNAPIAKANPKIPRGFQELRDLWLSKITYLHRFAERAGESPDIVEARRIVAVIEKEWLRRSGLGPEHPDYFKWPSTEALRGDGNLDVRGWQITGMLSYLGYRVGIGADSRDAERHSFLSHLFVMNLPPLNGPSYLQEWAPPGTEARLKKMAYSIASFVRQAKRRKTTNLKEAIRQWENDLKFLHDRYYLGKFGFGWPNI